MQTKKIDSNNSQYIIITDLDGTLLDHDNYSFSAALPALEKLEQQQIPVIINSSKTSAEITTLRHQLNNSHPFIIENGSAIFTPAGYFKSNTSTTLNMSDGKNEPLEEIILGERRSKILDIINECGTHYQSEFVQYSQCSAEDIVTLTGLPLEDAKKSSERFYTEPLKWTGSESLKQEFIDDIKERGLHTLQGGRFLHVMGLTDKGQANQHIKALYHDFYASVNPSKKGNNVKVIALGDSHNDIAMLQAADIAVVIRSPHYPPPEFDHPHKIISNAYGPEGWNECIQQLIFNQ